MIENMTVNEKFIHDFQGIVADYLIVTNRFSAFDLPEFRFENFKSLTKWEVARIEINDKPFLILDLAWMSFSYSKYIRCSKRIITQGMDSTTALDNLIAYSKMLDIPILNQVGYYMTGIPKNFKLED